VRVVSLTCSNTELVAALGCGHLLVGVDADSDHPPELVAGLPRVGRDLHVDADAVAALRPDLVLASLTVPGHEHVVARLAARKLPMLVLAPTSLEATLQDLSWVGGVLGVPERAAALRASLEAALAPDPAADRGPRVLVEWWPRPVIAAGARSWVNGVLAAAGARNAAAGLDAESAPLTDEQVRAFAPDVVLVSWCGVPPHKLQPERVLRRDWAGVPAFDQGRVYALPEAFLGRPGPRLAEGVARIRELLRATP